MNFSKELELLFKNGQEKFVTNISVDCVIFGFHENVLKALLLKTKYAGDWALPGGFLLKEEHLDDAAKRILMERTGTKNIFMHQFYIFSEPNRSTKKINQQFLKNIGISMEQSWMFDRFLTVGYTALVELEKVKPVVDNLSSAISWHDIHKLPKMILDHSLILKKALENLKLHLNYMPIGINLLPEKFTMPELQKLYETILDRKLDKRNFIRKITSTGILVKHDETKKGLAHKSPNFYSFDKLNYTKALKIGMGFDL